MTHAGEAKCRCVRWHRPLPVDIDVHHVWPQGWCGPESSDNRVAICQTGHRIVHRHLDRWRRVGQPLPRTRRDNRYLYALALEGWTRWAAAGKPER